MNLLNEKLIILGALLAFVMFCCNILSSILCKIFKIKIIQFTMFLSPKFSLYIESIMRVKYVLGWLPFGSFIKVLGKTSEINEQNTIPKEELPFAFFVKKDYEKLLILFVPTIIYLLLGIITSFVMLKIFNKYFNVDDVFLYLKEAIKSMFCDEQQIIKFNQLSKKYTSENDIIIFSYFIFSCILFFCSFFDNLISYLNLKSNQSKTKKTIILVLSIVPSIFMIWKIPVLIFEYYTLGQILVYVVNCLLGIFISGIILFFTTILTLKISNLNKSYS